MFPFRSKKYQHKLRLQERQDELPLAAGQWIMRREQLPEYRFALAMLTQGEKEAVYWSEWDTLDELAKRDLARETFGGCWYKLLANYAAEPVNRKLQILETLGYIHNENVVDFLLNEMKREDEGLRLAASAALKRQNPVLTVEPMLNALGKPEVFLAARIYDVLRDIGPKLVPVILQRLPYTGANGQLVMIQLLGAFGDESVIPALADMTTNADYSIRKAAAESLAQVGTDAAWPVLEPLLADPEWQIRLVVVKAMGQHHYSQGLAQLEQALARENDSVVREMMVTLLDQLSMDEMTTETFIWQRQKKGKTLSNGYSKRLDNRNGGRDQPRGRGTGRHFS